MTICSSVSLFLRTLATTCAAGGQRTFQVPELASRFSSRSAEREKQKVNCGQVHCKLCRTHAVIKKSVREQLSTVIDETLNAVVMMHVIRVEFLTNAIQRNWTEKKEKVFVESFLQLSTQLKTHLNTIS